VAPGTLFRASQFLSEELPIRLAHRVEELADLPDGLNEMPSIKRVQDWYAQSFEVRQRHPEAHRKQTLMVAAGNHFPSETQPKRRSQRAPLKTYQESKSRKGPERDIRKSQCQAWPISIAARENTRQREWQRRIKSQWLTKVLHWHRRGQRTMASRVGRLQQQICWHT
jgi:hypothetical protein